MQGEQTMEERERTVLNGWFMLAVTILTWLALPAVVTRNVQLLAGPAHLQPGLGEWAVVPLLLILGVFLSAGFFTLQPNEGRVLVLFGKYVGTVRKSGFHWANPFSVLRNAPTASQLAGKEAPAAPVKNKYVISLRARNFETAVLKVNDQRGNPIEIAAVVVWRVVDTADALFQVTDYENFLHVQAESAVRVLATTYPYDAHEEGQIALRISAAEVAHKLREEIQERLVQAGIEVIEARISHLAYAPEIASAMLRRQQANAIIAARKCIVEGAVSMVEMALEQLSARHVVELDEERKAAMVSNLLVVLCGDRDPQPVVNAGTLYH
jgi:regulator of protease activity HflC (stomatin/prohibitin superfamily)